MWRVVSDTGHVSWQIYTACPDRGAPFERMLGTFMLIQEDGSVDLVTSRPDGTVEYMEVMPCAEPR